MVRGPLGGIHPANGAQQVSRSPVVGGDDHHALTGRRLVIHVNVLLEMRSTRIKDV